MGNHIKYKVYLVSSSIIFIGKNAIVHIMELAWWYVYQSFQTCDANPLCHMCAPNFVTEASACGSGWRRERAREVRCTTVGGSDGGSHLRNGSQSIFDVEVVRLCLRSFQVQLEAPALSQQLFSPHCARTKLPLGHHVTATTGTPGNRRQ